MALLRRYTRTTPTIASVWRSLSTESSSMPGKADPVDFNATLDDASRAMLLPIHYKPPRRKALMKNPFFQPIQAWMRDFSSGIPQRIIHLNARIFGTPIRKDIMHDVYIWHNACIRSGTAFVPNRSQVMGSNRKIQPQKGTGKARVGQSRAPHRVNSGKAFGPKPKDWSYWLPVKIRQAGLRSALTAKLQQEELLFIDSATFPTTKEAVTDMLQSYPESKKHKPLVIDTKELTTGKTTYQDSFQLMTVDSELNVVHVLKAKQVFITSDALAYYEKELKPSYHED